MSVSPSATSTYRLPRTTPLMACWRTTVRASGTRRRGLLPVEHLPRGVGLRLHVVDRVGHDVLVGLVELHAARHALKAARVGEQIADGLRILAAAAYDVRHQQDLVIGVRVDMGGVLVVLRLERL